MQLKGFKNLVYSLTFTILCFDILQLIRQKIMRLNNIRLLVKNFDTCFSFYKDGLGLTVTWGNKGGVYASFDIGLSSGLSLFKAELMESVLGQTPSDKKPYKTDHFVIVIEVENVDEYYAILKEKGLKFSSEPKDMPDWGIRVAHLRDPEQNLIEIYNNLPK